MNTCSYEEVRKYREHEISKYIHEPLFLNQFHDQIMLNVIRIALEQVEKDFGRAPVPFVFFVMGSAGRLEQGLWSDQDHGIIYDGTNQKNKNYFLSLGIEISKGLHQAGYQYCDGGVMASNPFWCKSQLEWKQQINNWFQKQSWEDIRNLVIFLDSRALYGEKEYLLRTKEFTLHSITNKGLLPAIYKNTNFFKKGIGILGQLLVETHGRYAGQLNIKQTVLFPFVNSVRLLAIKEKITESSTLFRIERVSEQTFSKATKEKYKDAFNRLLKFRLLYCNYTDYEGGHFLNINKLSKEQRTEIKEIIKAAYSLNHQLERLIEKEGFYEDE